MIGEGTWGGANQVPNPRQVTQGFLAYIPNGQMGSSLTGKNWEGVGVIPDFPVIARVFQERGVESIPDREWAAGPGRSGKRDHLPPGPFWMGFPP